ncbi:hypothetical protein KP509_22G048500 [Ceratopteris richardii]|nr:hypothetical protein KP509_22G048500 [Ceratopteris richardii]KAH7307159.1 hypothetical protein KP509_22G048500 [Ceratopteris richardii]KAH7307160.1 hypothetical protein KP509_22G048500 [Ceratopteris richardii]KAH7307161.1 hypothetical protein KP509_22G048500 [Ceratopteris richardii]KAH7307162.1 hypothetical protein KP509_22G048500 [Ceratopteris richardii]
MAAEDDELLENISMYPIDQDGEEFEGPESNDGNIKNQHPNSWNYAWKFYLWLKTLQEAFGAPFMAVIIIVYGISQGYVGTVRNLATNYYWKDVQKLQPAASQAFEAFIIMPWNIKPIYGLITDTFPIGGFQRRPYLVICGVGGALCLWILSLLSSPSPWLATLLMAGVALCTAFPDVVVDAAVAEQSRYRPTLASDLQSLSWGSLSLGGLVGSIISGPAVHSFGPRGSFLLISVAPLLLLVAGWAIPEAQLQKGQYKSRFKELMKTLLLFKQTLSNPAIWRPALFIYLARALCPDISESMFYWFTDPVVGPGFSEQFIGLVGGIGYLAMFLGVGMYNCWFRSYSLRIMFFWPQIAYAASGLCDTIIVNRWNLRMGIPDHAFVVGDETLTDIIGRLQLIPFMVLSARLCPPGVEGTVFAFLMSVSNFGATCASWNGAFLLQQLHINREDYSNLWIAIVLRSLLRLTPLIFLFLLPLGTVDDLEVPDIVQGDIVQSVLKDEETINMLQTCQEMVDLKH